MLPAIEDMTQNYSREIKQGSSTVVLARDCVTFLSKVISGIRWNNAQELIDILKSVGRSLNSCHPAKPVLGNVVRHVLKIVRDEYSSEIKGRQEGGEGQSLHTLGTGVTEIDDYTKPLPPLKSHVMESIQELLEDMDVSMRNIAQQSLEHIHTEEVIMTMGNSPFVESFLKNAGKKRKFHVIVAETAPFYTGQELAVSLGRDGIETTVIPDASIFALMSRINKVLIGSDCVLANGGLLAVNGSHGMALAASHHSVPLIVCAPLYTLTPKYTASKEELGEFLSPEAVLGYSQASLVSRVQVLNPLLDYVPPELVTLFISNIGGNSPSYVYRLLSELYHQDDYEL